MELMTLSVNTAPRQRIYWKAAAESGGEPRRPLGWPA